MKVSSKLKYYIGEEGIRVLGVIDGKFTSVEAPDKPHAYIDAEYVDELSRFNGVIGVRDEGLVDEFNKPVITFYTKEPSDISHIRRTLERKGIQTYEADIPFVYRLIYDEKFEVQYDPSQIAFVDIEVYDKDGMPQDGEKPVLSIALYEMDGKARWFYVGDYPNEKAMLRAFISYLRQSGKTIFTAWNVQFDYDYLMARCEKLGVDNLYLSLMHDEDLLTYYKQIVKGLPSYKLEYVAEYEGIAPKVKHDNYIADMTREELEHYNMRDAFIIWQIERKHFLIHRVIALANTFNVTIDMLNATRLWDALNARRVRELGKVMRNNVKREKTSKYEGALVIEPKVGLWENVGYFDVESLYPNVLMHKNVDIGNFNGEVMPYLIRKYFELRREYKKKRNEYPEGSPEYLYYDLLQYSYKIVINSGYGIFGTPHFRYYDPDKALIVTRGGQEVLRTMAEFINNELGLKTIYGDTDSLFVLLHDKDPSIVEHLINVYIAPYRVKIEYVFAKLIMIKSASGEGAAKKRYIGLTVDGKMVFRGIELRRGDIPELAKTVMQDVIDMIFKGASKSEVYEYLNDIERRMRKGEFNEQLIINIGVKDNIGDYKNKPPHVRAYEMAIMQGYKPPDNIISFVFANGDVVPVTPRTDLNSLVFNYNYYWERYIMAPIRRILSSVYTQQKTLLEYRGL